MTSAMRWVAGAAVLLLAGQSPGPARADGETGMPLVDDPTLIALAVALSCAEAPPEASAQEPGGPEVELVATVRARALRFEEVPRLDAVFRGAGPHRATWRTERVNLPAHPEPGVVYRGVLLRLTVSSDVEGLSAMLRDAKRASRGIRMDDLGAPAVDPVAVATATPAPETAISATATTFTSTSTSTNLAAPPPPPSTASPTPTASPPPTASPTAPGAEPPAATVTFTGSR